MTPRSLLRQLSLSTVLYLCMMAFPFGLAHAGLACEIKEKKPVLHKKAVAKPGTPNKTKHPLDIFHR